MLNEKDEFKRFETETLLTGRTQIDSALGANPNDFNIDANNILNLKNKTSYWSCNGANFHPLAPDVDDHSYTVAHGNISAQADNLNFVANVSLPQGAVVTAAIVYSGGVAGTENWILRRVQQGTYTEEDMAAANPNVQDTSIAAGTETIDNSVYSYFLVVEDIDIDGDITSARITYTTDYD